jgi:hypothetical protein
MMFAYLIITTLIQTIEVSKVALNSQEKEIIGIAK